MPFLVFLKNSLFGRMKISVRKSDATDVLNICMRESIPYAEMLPCDDAIIFDMSLASGKRLSRSLAALGTEHGVSISGLPRLLRRFEKRYGAILGLVISFIIIRLGSGIVWDIRVTGNSSLTEKQVEDELRAVGFGIGSRIGERDVDEISNKLLAGSDDISWLSINFTGTVANVQIRENRAPESENETTYANIVAARDGTIDRFSVRRGRIVVGEGDTVRAGELIVSGITENNKGEIGYEAAQGEVFAVTSHRFELDIPLEYDDYSVKERKLIKKSLVFFGKSIFFYKKNCNSDVFCDTIIVEDTLSYFGLPSLPVSIVSEYAELTESERKKRSIDAASELAFFELNKLISTELVGADILSKSITTEIGDTSLKLSCDIICSENIAKRVPFTVN